MNYRQIDEAAEPTGVGKLIIQIPCYNEAGTLAQALAALPREVPGVHIVEWLIVDDGSVDGTADIARASGVDHIVRLRRNRGLAFAWRTGIETALRAGADVIVNTDADNQYDAGAIPDLVAPIVDGRADVAVGRRPIRSIQHFSPLKKALQRLGSAVMRAMSRIDVEDAPSGFRALSREAALQMTVLDGYTYTLETLFHAGRLRLAVVNVPVAVNADLRPSRLVKSILSYVRRSAVTMLRFYLAYEAPRLCLIGAGSSVVAAAGSLAAWAFWDGGVVAVLVAVSCGLLSATFLLAALLADGLLMVRQLTADTRRIALEMATREGRPEIVGATPSAPRTPSPAPSVVADPGYLTDVAAKDPAKAWERADAAVDATTGSDRS